MKNVGDTVEIFNSKIRKLEIVHKSGKATKLLKIVAVGEIEL